MKLVKFNEKDFIEEQFEMIALLNIEYGEEERWVTGKIERSEATDMDVCCRIYDYYRDDYDIVPLANSKVKFYASLE